jgi:hypothetical protein
MFRYEAYLVVIALLVAYCILPLLHWQSNVYSLLLIVIILLPLGGRAIEAARRTPLRTHDRYREHYRMAKFVNEQYPNCIIVANDIGALCFDTDATVFDLYGLGSLRPFRERRKQGGYTAADVARWSAEEQATMAIIHMDWHEAISRVPTTWRLVQRWDLPRNVLFRDSLRIGFYEIPQSDSR